MAKRTKPDSADSEESADRSLAPEDELDPLYSVRALVRREASLLRLLIDNLPDSIFIKDTDSRFLLSNRAHLRVCGVTEQAQLRGKTDFDVFPEELASRYFADESAVLQTGEGVVDLEEPGVLSDGSQAWFSTTKVPIRDRAGRVAGLIGISRNTTERKRAEEALERERNLLRILIDNIPDYIFVKDVESRFVISNKAHLGAMGVADQAQVIGKTDFDFFPRDLAQRYYADERRVARTGTPIVNIEEPTRTSLGESIWLSTTKVPIHDKQGAIVGIVGISRNITERKRFEVALQRANDELEMRVQERTADLREVNTRLAARLEQLDYLHETSYELAQYIGMEELGPAIVKSFSARLAGSEVALCLRDAGRVTFLCATPAMSSRLGQKAAERAIDVFSGIELQRPFMCEDWRRDEHLGAIDWPGLEHLPCYIAIPLLADNRTLAIVQIFAVAGVVAHYDAELPVLTTLAAHAASCLSNAVHFHELGKTARMQGELDAGRSIQQRFTPSEKPAIPRLDIKAAYIPAHEVGGDYLDYFPTPSGAWVMVVADVCGKGVPAALFMIMLRSAFRLESRTATGAKSLLCSVNDAMGTSLDDRSFVTALCLMVQPDGRSMTYARAGHPFLLTMNRKDGTVETVQSDGLAMGLVPENAIFNDMLQEVSLELKKGDRFLVYTDGLTEATAKDKQAYGIDKLRVFLGANWHHPPDALIAALVADVQEFCRPDPVHDDLTILDIAVVG